MQWMTVEDVMTRLVVKLYRNDSIHEATARLAQNDVGGGPVVEAGQVVGIVSAGDLATALEDARVGWIMTERVVTIGPDATIVEAAGVMDRYGVKRLPVCDDQGDLVGLVSRSDLVGALARTDAHPRSA